MLIRRFAIASLLLFPALASGQAIPAGFAPGSLWLSSTQITAGDTVHIFTVVYNSSTEPLSGDVAFSVDASTIGTASFDLSPGQTQVESQDWIASAGAHTFQANVENVKDDATKQAVALGSAATSESISATVAPAPPPAPPLPPSQTQQAVQEVSSAAASIASSSGPVASSIYNGIESLRQEGIGYLSDQVGSTTASPAAQQGQVLGTSTARAAAGSPTLWQHIASVLLWIFNFQILFFVLFIILVLIGVWLLWRAVRRFGMRRPNKY